MRLLALLSLLGADDLRWVPGECHMQGDMIWCDQGRAAATSIGEDELIATPRPREHFERQVEGMQIVCGYGGKITSKPGRARNELWLDCTQQVRCGNEAAVARLEVRDSGTFVVCDARKDGGR